MLFKESSETAAIILEENKYTTISNGVMQITNKKYVNDDSVIETFTTYDYAERITEVKYSDGTKETYVYNVYGKSSVPC